MSQEGESNQDVVEKQQQEEEQQNEENQQEENQQEENQQEENQQEENQQEEKVEDQQEEQQEQKEEPSPSNEEQEEQIEKKREVPNQATEEPKEPKVDSTTTTTTTTAAETTESTPGAASTSAEPAVYIATKTSDERSFPKTTEQSIQVGEERSRRRKGYESALIVRRFEDVHTAYHSFKRSAAKWPEKHCMGVRAKDKETGKTLSNFVFQTYTQVYKRIKNLAAGMVLNGAKPNDHIGIYSKNRPEWQIVAEACHTQSMVSIALYDTLGEDSSLYIMNHGEISTLCCSGEVIKNVLLIIGKCEYLRTLIVFDDLTEEQKQELSKANPKVTVKHIREVEKEGEGNPVDDVPPTADSLCTIMYTSGTTGMPKGVMITHRNVIAACTGICHAMFEVSTEDSLISYLPLAHIFERVAEFVMFQHGASVGYWQGDIKLLPDDIKDFRPSVLPAVPRVLDRMYDKIKGRVDQTTGLKKTIFDYCFGIKKDSVKKSERTPLSDILVFNKFKDGTGGRLRGILSGGAPLRSEVQDFLSTCFGIPICQGYGLTETCAAGTIQLPYDFQYGHVGTPLACNEVKLVDVPEMNYLSTNNPPTGEVCFRGPNVSLGYYKEQKKTAEVFENSGWFHTGDIGRWNPNGTLSIIDRVKNIFKLAQGEYVAAENIELKIGQASGVSQIWVYGDSLKSSLVAVIVVEPTYITSFAKEKGISGDISTIVQNPEVVKHLLGNVVKIAKAAKLHSYEIPRRVHLVDREFMTYDAITPSMKLKRNKLKEVFQQEIDRMYAEIDEEDEKKKKQQK